MGFVPSAIRFAQVLGRAPAEEIRRLPLERAKQLLAETSMPLPDVVQSAGFGLPEYLAYVFRKDVRMFPRDCRRPTGKT
jgi:LacI family transcriptional regulator